MGALVVSDVLSTLFILYLHYNVHSIDKSLDDNTINDNSASTIEMGTIVSPKKTISQKISPEISQEVKKEEIKLVS